MGTRILPNALHFKEFYGGYHGTCGETALATAIVCASPEIESTEDAIALMLSLTREMIGLKWAGSSGASTMAHLLDEAVRKGCTYDHASYVSFEQPLPAEGFHNLLLSTAGIHPIVVEIAAAGAGLPGDEAGVQYHYICIVGITDAGYICNDGDNAAIGSHLVTYSFSEIEQAIPCAVLVLEGAPDMSGAVNDLAKVTQDAINAEHERDTALSELAQTKAQLAKVTADAIAAEKERDAASAEITSLKAQLAQAPAPLDPSVHQALAAALQVLQPMSVVVGDIQKALSKLS